MSLMGGCTRRCMTTMNNGRIQLLHRNVVSRRASRSLVSSSCCLSWKHVTKRAFPVGSYNFQFQLSMKNAGSYHSSSIDLLPINNDHTKNHCVQKRFYKASSSNEKSSTIAFGDDKSQQLTSSTHEPTFSTVHYNDLSSSTIPKYLVDVYWWAYIHPVSIRLLDCQPLVNMILWGNFNLLRDIALDELASSTTCKSFSDTSCVHKDIKSIQGRTLQVACVYGDFTEKLLDRMVDEDSSTTSSLEVVDAVPAQLENLKCKLEKNLTLRGRVQYKNNDRMDQTRDHAVENKSNRSKVLLACSNVANPIRTREILCHDYDNLDRPFDQAIVFFLLHEMPSAVRIQTIQNMISLLKPNGGKLVFIDYHRPQSRLYRFLLSCVFDTLEPFAKDMWNMEIQDWIPESERTINNLIIQKETYCGGLYQKVVVERKDP